MVVRWMTHCGSHLHGKEGMDKLIQRPLLMFVNDPYIYRFMCENVTTMRGGDTPSFSYMLQQKNHSEDLF